MQTSHTCPYVHYIKHWEVLQEHSGSFIGRDGTFGEVVWKGSVGVHDSGGTPRKKASVWHPMALGSRAAPSARHTAARRTPSPAVRRRLRRAHQAAEEGAAVLGEELPEGRTSEPGAVGGAGSLPEPRQLSGCCVLLAGRRAAGALVWRGVGSRWRGEKSALKFLYSHFPSGSCFTLSDMFGG